MKLDTKAIQFGPCWHILKEEEDVFIAVIIILQMQHSMIGNANKRYPLSRPSTTAEGIQEEAAAEACDAEAL